MASANNAKKGANVRMKRKERKNIAAGQAHIQSTFNNTVVTKFCSNLAVTLKKILTSHTLLTRSTTRRNNVFSTSESLLWVNSISYVNTWECALLNFIENTMYTWLEDIIKTDVWSKTEHQSALYHVRTDHTACTDDNEFVIC